jgi:DNA polymerase III delta prime subunit
MIPFIYKYMPSSLEEFELESKSSLLYNTNVLLLGPERSGKTTLASLIVQTIDPDKVLYINVLKEQGIQYYRNEVKTFCQSTTTQKKIIVDGLDEMNEQTQQIFLNYIDTYPTIQFILTVTNPQKIMESIYSTCMVIRLTPVSDTYLHSFIEKICSLENITIYKDAQDYLVSLTRPSVRSLLNYLEKYKLLEIPITIEHLRKTHTDIPFSLFDSFFSHIKNGNKKEAQCIITLYQDGYSVMDILDACYEYIKLSSIPDMYKYKYIKVICKYIAIFNIVHEHPIELFFFIEDCIKISNDSHNLHK